MHETDFAPYGAEKTGVFTIEHRILQSENTSTKNQYQNCLLACRHCNRARYVAPIQNAEGRRLLDPTETAWSEHFEATAGELAPKPNDEDAEYTQQAYAINDRLKVALRKKRSQQIEDKLTTLREHPTLIASLLSAASQEPNPARAKQLTEAAQYMARAVRLAKEELSRDWNAIPNDADPECRCKTTKEHSLPRGLETQLLNTL